MASAVVVRATDIRRIDFWFVLLARPALVGVPALANGCADGRVGNMGMVQAPAQHIR